VSAIDMQFHATVLCPPSFRLVVGHRLTFALALTAFDSAQVTTDQAADNTADRPGTLIQRGIAIAVSSATGQEAAKHRNRQDSP
jgi:hypothetical protein